MMYLMRAVFSVLLLGGFALTVLTQWNGGRAEAAVKVAPADDVAQFAARCEQTLTLHDHDFSAKVSIGDGCACLARELAETHATDLVAAEILLVGVVETPVLGRRAEPDWASIARQTGMTDMDLGRLVQASYAALGICGEA